MGVTVDAIRKRISRDTIPHERDDDGRVWVILDTDQDAASNVRDTDRPPSESSALISEMRAHNATLQAQLEAERQAHAEARRIIAGLVERLPPQLEAPSSQESSRESPESVGEEPERAEPWAGARGREERLTRPWWRRVFRGR